jgi:ribonuclease P protein component
MICVAALSPLADPALPIMDVIVAKRDCSKLAVERSRARRRIEAAARLVLSQHACRGA